MERVWIYQANRKLSETEAELVLKKMEAFTLQWRAHGKQLVAQAALRYNQFLILRVNEGLVQATGCSIDKSTYLLKDIQEELGIDFFDRLQIAYRKGDEIAVASKREFEQLIQDGLVNENTIVFNNMVDNGADLETKWEVPLKESWHAKVFAVNV